jgi:hypothetical protein
MDVLGDVIARDRRSERPALAVPAVGRRYDYRRFCTNAWKTGNFLRHLGVRGGAVVAVADDPLPEPIVTFLGAGALGAVVGFGPPAEIDAGTRALVVPAADVDDYAVGPSTKRVAYGDPPDDPTVSYFERDVWSENPTAPPDRVDPEAPLLRTDTDEYSHRELLAAARAVVDDHGLGPTSAVAVRGSFADPSVVAAGLIAPLIAGGEIVLGGDAGDVVVGGPDRDVELGPEDIAQ